MVGKLITFEGIDGSGKSTQIKLLENELDKIGISYKTFREPGGTVLSEKIREILLDKKNIALTSVGESLLFAAARAQLTSEQILPSINSGKFVICDRFADSTIAYQGYGRGLNIEHLEKINNIATGGLNPDVTFILDIEPEIAAERINSITLDRMEALGADFFNKIRKGYSRIKQQYPNRCIEINADRLPGDIFSDIKEIIMKKFEEVFICSQ